MTQDEIAKLSAAQRLSLIGELWDSLADTETPLPQAQQDELLRRLASFDEDKAQAVPWDAIKADLRAPKR
jgi:putative addiction module component (TIGR02574 family)